MQQQDGLFKWQELDRCWRGAGVGGWDLYFTDGRLPAHDVRHTCENINDYSENLIHLKPKRVSECQTQTLKAPRRVD